LRIVIVIVYHKFTINSSLLDETGEMGGRGEERGVKAQLFFELQCF